MCKPLVIGLTGPTGSGKSELTRLLAARGAYVIDADVLARQAVEPGGACLAALVDHFSEAILQPDGSLNRVALAHLAFASPEETKVLNDLVHPAVIARIRCELETARRQRAPITVLDAPLLFQAGLDVLCDYTVAVTAPAAVRRERICRRDGLTVAAAEERMRAQPPADYYTGRATCTVENAGSPEELKQAETALYRRIERWRHEAAMATDNS